MRPRHLSTAFGFTVLAFALAFGTRVPLHAQPPAGQAPPAPVPGQTASQRYKNVQVLKDVPAEQLRLAMEYITASLGVGCDFCHVTGPGGGFDKDDKEPKRSRPRHDEDDGGDQHRAVRGAPDDRVHVVPQRQVASVADAGAGGGDDA